MAEVSGTCYNTLHPCGKVREGGKERSHETRGLRCLCLVFTAELVGNVKISSGSGHFRHRRKKEETGNRNDNDDGAVYGVNIKSVR